jgi:curli production assembly/transport component CsgG
VGEIRIGVMTFHSPTGRFGTSVSSELQSRLVANAGDNFKIVDQTEVKKLLETQQAGESGAFDESTVASTGKLLGADGMVFGSIDDDSKLENETVLTEVTKYKADTGDEYTEKCPTVIRSAHLGVTFKVVKVETGEVLAQTHKTYDMQTKKVNDPNPANPFVKPGTAPLLRALFPNPFLGQLTSDEVMQQQLAQQSAIDFSKMIMPYSESVIVQWDTAVAPQDALKMIQATLFTEGREIVEKAVPELEQDPKIAKDKHKLGGLYYDTGVAYELEGRPEDALTWYKKAILTGDNDGQVRDAVMRVKGLISSAEMLQTQTVH